MIKGFLEEIRQAVLPSIKLTQIGDSPFDAYSAELCRGSITIEASNQRTAIQAAHLFAHLLPRKKVAPFLGKVTPRYPYRYLMASSEAAEQTARNALLKGFNGVIISDSAQVEFYKECGLHVLLNGGPTEVAADGFCWRPELTDPRSVRDATQYQYFLQQIRKNEGLLKKKQHLLLDLSRVRHAAEWFCDLTLDVSSTTALLFPAFTSKDSQATVFWDSLLGIRGRVETMLIPILSHATKEHLLSCTGHMTRHNFGGVLSVDPLIDSWLVAQSQWGVVDSTSLNEILI